MDKNRREQLAEFAFGIRRNCIRMTNHGHSGHVGSMLSMADTIAVLYNGILNVDAAQPKMDSRDRFVLSKGHAGAAVYAALCAKGFLPEDWLMTYYCDEGKLMGHISHHVPGVEFSTGSLGHGLPVAVGMALAAKLQKKTHKVYCMMSDGDMNEGSSWEAIIFAAQQKLSNLVGIVDYNRVQALGHSEDVADLEPLDKKLELFGWNCVTVDGHDLEALENTFTSLPDNGKPTMVICRTVKARGVPWLEDTVKSHYGFIPDELVEDAIAGCRAFAEECKKGE